MGVFLLHWENTKRIAITLPIAIGLATQSQINEGPMHIVDGRLQGVRFVKAKFYGERIRRRRFIIAHSTCGAINKFSTVNYIKKPWDRKRRKWRKVSYHVIIERGETEDDAVITQMVPFNYKAFHAGVSRWKGFNYLNSDSIGIAIVAPGKLTQDGRMVGSSYRLPEHLDLVHKETDAHGDGYWLPPTDGQIKAFTRVSRALAEWDEDTNEILAHWEVSPGRKIDPNPLFPLEHIRQQVFDPHEDTPELVEEPELVREVKAHDGKTLATSKVATTAVVQGTGGAALTTIALLDSASQQVKSVTTSTDTIVNSLSSPNVLIGLGLMAFAAFFFYDRRKKMKDHGV